MWCVEMASIAKLQSPVMGSADVRFGSLADMRLRVRGMSALRPKADMLSLAVNVR